MSIKGSEDLPLFSWQPKHSQVIVFPTAHRHGHARKLAAQLASAKTQREASYRLNRTCKTLHTQLQRAGIEPQERRTQVAEFLKLVRSHCIQLRAHRYLTMMRSRGAEGRPSREPFPHAQPGERTMAPTIAVISAEITHENLKLPSGHQIAVELSTPKARTIVFVKQDAETYVHAVCNDEAEAQAIAEALEREWSGGRLPDRQLQ